MSKMTILDDLQAALELLTATQATQAARIAERQDVQEQRMTALERVAEERLRGLQATVDDQHETLALAGEAMKAVQDVCARHGHNPASGMSVVAWLDHVLSWTADGWPSVN